MAHKYLCLLVCKNYDRETTSIIKSEKYTGIKIFTYPALCISAEQKTLSLSDILPSGTSKCGHIALIGGQCLKPLKLLPRKRSCLTYHVHDQCASLFINREIADRHKKDGAYTLTPAFLDRWRQCLKEMGHDQVSSRKYFRRSFSRIVFLDTGVGKNVARKLQEFSKYVNLPAETIPVGRGHFQLYLNNIILEWRLQNELARYKEVLKSRVFTKTDRREHQRYNIGRTCLVEMNDSEMVELKDISISGIRLKTPQFLYPDRVHRIKIFPSLKEKICLAGKVVWTASQGIDGSTSNYETGLKFDDMDSDTARSLSAFFSSISVSRKKHSGLKSL